MAYIQLKIIFDRKTTKTTEPSPAVRSKGGCSKVQHFEPVRLLHHLAPLEHLHRWEVTVWLGPLWYIYIYTHIIWYISGYLWIYVWYVYIYICITWYIHGIYLGQFHHDLIRSDRISHRWWCLFKGNHPLLWPNYSGRWMIIYPDRGVP